MEPQQEKTYPGKLFWENILPRIMGVLLFVWLLIILITSELSLLHVWIALIAGVLIVIPSAKSIKIPNLFEFKSKLDNVSKGLDEVKNQIASIATSNAISSTKQLSIISIADTGSLTKLVENFAKTSPELNETDGKQEFFQKSKSCLTKAQAVLVQARFVQIAALEKHIPKATELGSHDGTEEQFLRGLVKQFIKNDVSMLVLDSELESTVKNLGLILDLIELLEQIANGKKNIPTKTEYNEIFSGIRKAYSTLSVGVEMQAARGILHVLGLQKTLQEIRDKYCPDEPVLDNNERPWALSKFIHVTREDEAA